MLAIVETLNELSPGWLALAVAILWQSSLLIVAVAAVAWIMRRASPAVRYWLWQLVAVKLLLMPLWTASIAVPWPTEPLANSMQLATAGTESPACDQWAINRGGHSAGEYMQTLIRVVSFISQSGNTPATVALSVGFALPEEDASLNVRARHTETTP
jgi:hypothetical protein